MVFRSLPVFVSTLLALAQIPSISAFSFTTATPTSCDDVKITWSGGTAPFTLLLTPIFGTPRNVSIPDSSYSNGNGSYTISQLPFNSGQKMMMTMSDATGFGTGGNTAIMQVGSSSGGNSCDTSDPGVAFSFELNTALQQCRAYTISGYGKATQPVTIIGLIPDGDSFVLSPPKGNSYDWNADVWNGTDIVFSVIDAQGRQGGSSDVKTVGISDDTSCIDSSSPSVTADPSQSSATQTSSTSSAASESSGSSGSSNSTSHAALAGTVIAVLVFIAACMSFWLLYWKRKQERKDTEWGAKNQRNSLRLQSEVDLATPHTAPGSAFPFLSQDSASVNGVYAASHYSDGQSLSQNMSTTNVNPFNSSQDHVTNAPGVDPFMATQSPTRPENMTAGQRKAAMAGGSTHRPSRYVLHTDVDDVPELPANEDGVVELPPQYSERRTAPAPAPAPSHDVPSYSPPSSGHT